MELVLETASFRDIATRECELKIAERIGEISSTVPQAEAMEILRASRDIKLFTRTLAVPMFLAARQDMEWFLAQMREEEIIPSRIQSIRSEAMSCRRYLQSL